MTEKWEVLNRKERQLSYQLEDIENTRFRAEQVLGDFENYDYGGRTISLNNAWDAAYGSKYATQLGEQGEQLHELRNQVFETFIDGVDELKHQARQIEDEMEAIYVAKRKENLK